MFTRESGQGDGDPQSWYGEPQHEEVDRCEWETAYYGEAHEENLQSDIEFIPEIEHPAEFLGEASGAVGRRLGRLVP